MFQTLLTTSLAEGDISYLRRLPKVLLEDDQSEAIKWVEEYAKKFSIPPSPGRFQASEHGKWCQKIFKSADPLADIYEQTVLLLKQQRLRLLADELISEDPTGRAPIIRKMLEIESVVGTKKKVVSVKTVDRNKMYDGHGKSSIMFGLSTIDSITQGLLPGEIAFIAGRPGVGKTMILTYVASNLMRLGNAVFFNSKEMPIESVTSRLDGILGGFDISIMRRRKAAGDQVDPMIEAQAQSAKEKIESILPTISGDILFTETPCSTVPELFDAALEAKADVIMADAVYLMTSAAFPNQDSRDWRVQAAVTSEIKERSMATGIPVIGTTQMRRGDKFSATLDDIAFSDSIAQDADIVMMMTPGENGAVAITVTKNRNGIKDIGQFIKFNLATGTLTEGGSLSDE